MQTCVQAHRSQHSHALLLFQNSLSLTAGLLRDAVGKGLAAASEWASVAGHLLRGLVERLWYRWHGRVQGCYAVFAVADSRCAWL